VVGRSTSPRQRLWSDRGLRLVAALPGAARERDGPPPPIDVADRLLDEGLLKSVSERTSRRLDLGSQFLTVGLTRVSFPASCLQHLVLSLVDKTAQVL